LILTTVLCGFAGCASKEPHYDAVISGGDTTSDIPPAPIITGVGHGNLEGLVVDPFKHPVKNATVTLAGTDVEATTDKSGTFLIQGLEEGTYGAVASAPNLQAATGTIIIKDGITTRAWFQLTPLPPPAPYHKTYFWNGTVFVTSDPVTRLDQLWCSGCTTSLPIGANFASLIVESNLTNPPPPVKPFPDPLNLSNETTYYALYSRDMNRNVWSGWGPDTLWARTDTRLHGNYTLDIEPSSYPMPQQNAEYHGYATVFYGQRAPEGWSYLAGNR